MNINPPAAAGGAPAAPAGVGVAGLPLVPPVLLPNVIPLPLTDSSCRPYREWYMDTTGYPFIGNYAALYAHYTINANNQLASVRDQIFAAGNTGIPMCHLLLVRRPNAPAENPGTVQGFHQVVHYVPNLALTTNFDGVGFAFMVDIHQGQALPWWSLPTTTSINAMT